MSINKKPFSFSEVVNHKNSVLTHVCLENKRRFKEPLLVLLDLS